MRALAPFLILFGAVAFGSEKVPEKKAAKPAKSPETKSPEERLFRKRCSLCHDPMRVYHRIAGRDEWREIVRRMQRMPQSGISPRDATAIIDYLVSLRGQGVRRKAKGRFGGRKAFGDEWIAVLETARPDKEGRASLGGKTYKVSVDGLTAQLQRGKGKLHTVSLTAKGTAGATSLSKSWNIGDVTYEIHLILYAVFDGTPRFGRALRRMP